MLDKIRSNFIRKIIKARKIIHAEGFFVFFRKAVRRLYWELRNKYWHRTNDDKMNYRESVNQATRYCLLKKIPTTNLADKNPKAVLEFLENLKKQIVEANQEKKP